MAPLIANLEGDDLDGARGLTDDVWNRLEKRIRSKWQAYFILTFQDVSVERKAARDRQKLQPRFDMAGVENLARAEAMRNSMPDLLAPDPEPPARAILSPWLVVVAVLLVAAIGGWLLLRSH